MPIPSQVGNNRLIHLFVIHSTSFTYLSQSSSSSMVGNVPSLSFPDVTLVKAQFRERNVPLACPNWVLTLRPCARVVRRTARVDHRTAKVARLMARDDHRTAKDVRHTVKVARRTPRPDYHSAKVAHRTAKYARSTPRDDHPTPKDDHRIVKVARRSSTDDHRTEKVIRRTAKVAHLIAKVAHLTVKVAHRTAKVDRRTARDGHRTAKVDRRMMDARPLRRGHHITRAIRSITARRALHFPWGAPSGRRPCLTLPPLPLFWDHSQALPVSWARHPHFYADRLPSSPADLLPS